MMADRKAQKETLRAYFKEAAVNAVYKHHIEPMMNASDEEDHGIAMRDYADISPLGPTTPEALKELFDGTTLQKKEDLMRTLYSLGSVIENTIDDMMALRKEFLKAAEYGNEKGLKSIIEKGFPVNYQDPVIGETALHIAAACQARAAVKVLLNTGQCDHLLRDKQGRLASELAYLYGQDVAMARLLGNKERKQAEAQGVKVTRRP